MRVVISGGGTGGHVYPAIAIAQQIKADHPNAEILFIGAEGKIEMEKVPKAGFKIVGLNIRGFARKFSFENIKNIFRLIRSVTVVRRILTEFKPDIAVGFGGYASGPALYVAQRLGIPTILQEQNSYPGVTNKFLSKRAAKICVAYNGMDRYFDESKLVFSGNPVRNDLYNNTLSYQDSLAKFGLEKKQTILLFGGSLGARTLNDAVVANHKLLEENQDIQLIWQMGKLYTDEFSKSATAALPNVFPMPFIERMDMAYNAADIIICRAGALTISELALVAKPAIFVPSPNVAEDHQTKNAMALVQKDAALLIRDKEAKAELFKSALELLRDNKQQASLKSNIAFFGKPEAAEVISKEIANLADGRN